MYDSDSFRGMIGSLTDSIFNSIGKKLNKEGDEQCRKVLINSILPLVKFRINVLWSCTPSTGSAYSRGRTGSGEAGLCERMYVHRLGKEWAEWKTDQNHKRGLSS